MTQPKKGSIFDDYEENKQLAIEAFREYADHPLQAVTGRTLTRHLERTERWLPIETNRLLEAMAAEGVVTMVGTISDQEVKSQLELIDVVVDPPKDEPTPDDFVLNFRYW